MTAIAEWNVDLHDLDLQGLWEEGAHAEGVFYTREPSGLCAQDAIDGVDVRMAYGGSNGDASTEAKRLPSPPPSGGGEGELLVEHFLLGDDQGGGDAKPMPCLVGPQPSTPEETQISSSISTPAPQSPSLSTNASPPPDQGLKRRRDEPWSERSTSPEGNPGDLHLRPEDDPMGLFQRDPNTLTCEELKLLKKQKRLIKNRESAQLSRHRKKQHVEGLQAQMAALERERTVMEARMQELTRENAVLKQQLAESQLENSKMKSEAAAAAAAAAAATAGLSAQTLESASPPTASNTPSLTNTATRASVASVALATVFAVGLLFTGMDLRPASLPAPYRPQYSAIAPYEATADSASRRRGRVLLGASGEYGSAWEATQGMSDKKQLLIVTLLDHIVSGQMVSSPTLFSRLCNRLKAMGVLDDCGFVDSMDKVREQYLAEFGSLHEEFAKGEDEVQVDAQFSFDNSKALTKHSQPLWVSKASPSPLSLPALPPPPISGIPLSRDGMWGLLDGRAVHSKFNILCPAAQLLISDKPANNQDELASRLGRKERSPSLSNSTATGGERDGEPQLTGREGGLSMVLPRSVLQTHVLMSDSFDDAGLVEVRCEAFDLRPFSSHQRGLTSS